MCVCECQCVCVCVCVWSIIYRNSNAFHKFGNAFLAVCNRDTHITEGRTESLLTAYHITFGAKWMLHYSGLRERFPKHQASWMPQNPSFAPKAVNCLPLLCFVIATVRDTFGAQCCLQDHFCHKKRINFFLPFSIFITNFQLSWKWVLFSHNIPFLLPSLSQEWKSVRRAKPSLASEGCYNSLSWQRQ